MASLFLSAGPPYRPDVLGVGIAVAAAGCLLWQRTAPIPVLAVTAALVVVNAAAGYQPTVVWLPTWVALFTCFSLPRKDIWAVAVVVVGLGLAGWLLFDRDTIQIGTPFGVLMSYTFAMIGGDAVRSRGVAAAAEQGPRAARLARTHRP